MADHLVAPPVSRRQSFPVPLGLARNDMFMMKLMRLPSPFLRFSPPVPGPGSGTGDAFGDSSVGGLTPDLSLSTTLGTMYVGEVFRVCFSATHRFAFTLQRCGFRMEIQTQRTRVALLDTTADAQDMPRGETRDHILTHHITELEDNNLVCSAIYYDDLGRQQTFQKFFIIKVALPLQLSTRVMQNDDVVFAELVVTNVAPEPVFLDHIVLVTEPEFTARDVGKAVVGVSVVDDSLAQSSLAPQSSRVVVFRVMPRDPLDRSSATIGHFTVRWRSSLGRTGTLLTQAISRASPAGDVDLVVLEAPADAYLEQPIALRLEVHNRTAERLDLRLTASRDRAPGLAPWGLSSLLLGAFEPSERRTAVLHVVPLALGLQTVSGVTVSVDGGAVPPGAAPRSWEFDNLHQVIVRQPDEAQ